MAKRNKKNVSDVKRRSAAAVAAILKTGAGKHGDRRLKRMKTRAAQKRAAFRDWR